MKVDLKYMLKYPTPKDPPVWTKNHGKHYSYIEGFSRRPRLRGDDLVYTILKPLNAGMRIKQWRPQITVSPPYGESQTWGIKYGRGGFDPASDLRGRRPDTWWCQ